MGREAPSKGEPPASFRKAARAKKAKATLNKTIPALLTSHPRAKRGVQAAELISQPPARKNPATNPSPTPTPPSLTLSVTDTLTAAHRLLRNAETGDRDLSNTTARVGILNMASMLSPGGGFANGASGQEASLCMRTTLLPSLSDDFYRLPEVGGVYTPDVLVFRDEQAEDLDKASRWFVDVVSAGTLRFPETSVDETSGQASFVSAKDRELVGEKMRAVMRMFEARGVRRVVLGAWGCGAYGNPVGEVARAWRKVLVGRPLRSGKKGSSREMWEGIERVVFAIEDGGLAEGFGEAFGEGLDLEEEDESEGEDDVDGEDEDDVEAVRLREMQEKIAEMQIRVQQAKTPQLKAGLTSILAGLESQVPKD
ncbi:hypothetical protein Q7P37_002149 [Cladosporium fusiforme]